MKTTAILLATLLSGIVPAGADEAPVRGEIVQTFLVADFQPILGSRAEVDFATFGVNLVQGCCLSQGVDPPARSALSRFVFEACDSSSTGSVNLSILVCPSPGGGCTFIANVSTGAAETPGCVLIESEDFHPFDPSEKVVLFVTDTEPSDSTRAHAARLMWNSVGIEGEKAASGN